MSTQDDDDEESDKTEDEDIISNPSLLEETAEDNNKDDECGNWIDLLERVTNDAEANLQKHIVACWVETQRRLQWQALAVALHDDEKWMKATAMRSTELIPPPKAHRHLATGSKIKGSMGNI